MVRPLDAVRILQEVGASVSQRFPDEMVAEEPSLGLGEQVQGLQSWLGHEVFTKC